MPKATVRANAQALPEPTNRRAVLGAASDREVFDLWQRRLEYFRMALSGDVSGDESDRFGGLACDCLRELDKRIGASLLALGAVLVIAIENHGVEETFGLNRASLAAIRPGLSAMSPRPLIAS